MKKITSRTLLPFANGYILMSLLFYWFDTSLLGNPLALTFLGIFGLHLFVAKRGFKLIFPVIFIVINLYMFLALFSELSEFSTFNSEALLLLSVGVLYLGLNIACAVVMILNYSSTTQIPVNV